MTLTVIIQQDAEGWFLGSIPNLHGCRTQAKSLPELYERLKEVALLCLEEQKQPDTELRGILSDIEMSKDDFCAKIAGET